MDDSLVVAPYRNYSLLYGAGDMHATSNDLVKWANSFIDNKLLNGATQEMIFTPNKGYGLGWYIDTSEPAKYYHGGTTWGYSSYIAIYPEDEIIIILMSNVSTMPTESIGGDIEKMVYGLPFEIPEPKNITEVDSHTLDFYDGTYISDSGNLKLIISSRQDRLFAQLVGNPAFEIYPNGSHNFFGKKVEIDISFAVDDQTVKGLYTDRMGQTMYFKKL
jgi:CubicO group peptidase (beta-lactamase class C family)